MWNEGKGQFEQVSFENNVLEFKNRYTRRVYLCDGEFIKRKDGSDCTGELTKMNQKQVVIQYLYNVKMKQEKENENKIDN